jgi:hypothetical protein
MRVRMRVLGLATCLVLASAAEALAADPHSPSNPTGPATGRPTQSCQVTTTTPGNAVNAPGSAFNPTGQAGSVYAGQQPQNSAKGQAAQYDVACFQQP